MGGVWRRAFGGTERDLVGGASLSLGLVSANVTPSIGELSVSVQSIVSSNDGRFLLKLFLELLSMAMVESAALGLSIMF